ncbi:MAG: FHA domain-containing protein [Deltaproteobacteria bacterium]|nr:FHA domain-containing protein [Deltaproteobacteria bacterium]
MSQTKDPHALLLSLTLDVPGRKTTVLEFDAQESLMVGSGVSAAVRIEHDDVSSLHCMIKRDDDGQLIVLDLGSDEGTELNGCPISGPVFLDDGDTLSLGKASVVVHYGGEMLALTLPMHREETPQTSVQAAKEEERKEPIVEVNAADERIKAKVRAQFDDREHSEHTSALVKTAEYDLELPVEEQAPNRGLVEVSLRWGGSVMSMQRLAEQGSLTIGEDPSCAFQVTDPCIPSRIFPLVTLQDGAATLHLAAGMKTFIDGEEVHADTGLTVVLELGQQAIVEVGAIEFVVQYAMRNKSIQLGLLQAIDFFYTKVLAMVLMLQAMFIVAMVVTPHFGSGGNDDLEANMNEMLLSVMTEEDVKKKPEKAAEKKDAPKKNQGLFGAKDKPKKTAARSIDGAVNVDKDKREEDRKKVSDALAMLGLGPEAAFSNQLGPGGLGAGINSALGGLSKTGIGSTGGNGGLGSRGVGPGGGGNSLSIGGLSAGNGKCTGPNCSGVSFDKGSKRSIKVRPGTVIHKGSLSRAEIQRVVGRYLSKIKHCYEKELNKNPNLSGKIVGSWTIGGAGSVVAARASQNTMNNKTIGSCIVKNIKRMRFPRPKGGGSVFVTYPFVFDAK